MKWRWVLLISAISFMSAGSFAVVLNEPWLNDDDRSPNYTCDAAWANAYGPSGWQISCVADTGDHIQFNFDDPLPPEAGNDEWSCEEHTGTTDCEAES